MARRGIMKYSINENKWEWVNIKNGQVKENDVPSSLKNKEKINDWISNIQNKDSNNLNIDTVERGNEYMWGSLVYQQDIENINETHIFHFYITNNYLITVGLDFSEIENTDLKMLLKEMNHSDNAIGGFCILLGEFLNHYLIRIDHFELRLKNLMWKLKEKNNLGTLDQIFTCRHELLIWKNMTIPIHEIMLGAEEMMGTNIQSMPEYNRVKKRLERGRTIIHEYQQEIDTMIRLEEVVAHTRGNEIMKTLTVITMLFTPIMAWGALWGMNFKYMPELDWKYGYIGSWVLIIVTTIALYGYLKIKGWIGDLLKAKKKDSFFK
jgi:Mg2+ and Co2+ transporter CorA